MVACCYREPDTNEMAPFGKTAAAGCLSSAVCWPSCDVAMWLAPGIAEEWWFVSNVGVRQVCAENSQGANVSFTAQLHFTGFCASNERWGEPWAGSSGYTSFRNATTQPRETMQNCEEMWSVPVEWSIPRTDGLFHVAHALEADHPAHPGRPGLRRPGATSSTLNLPDSATYGK